jgi:hypothetical protein
MALFIVKRYRAIVLVRWRPSVPLHNWHPGGARIFVSQGTGGIRHRKTTDNDSDKDNSTPNLIEDTGVTQARVRNRAIVMVRWRPAVPLHNWHPGWCQDLREHRDWWDTTSLNNRQQIRKKEKYYHELDRGLNRGHSSSCC